jgi:hypothetical protein
MLRYLNTLIEVKTNAPKKLKQTDMHKKKRFVYYNINEISTAISHNLCNKYIPSQIK